MRQHAGLRRDVELLPDGVEHHEQRMRALHAVGCRIDADDGVAGAEQQPVENAGRDAARIVGRVVGLQPRRQAPGQADGAAEFGHRRAFRRHDHQILQPADLGDRRRHFRGDAGGKRRERLRSRIVRQQPVAQPADGQMRDGGKGVLVVAVDDKARHLVVLVRNDSLTEKCLERHVGECELRRHALFAAFRRKPGERVAAAQRGCFGHQHPEIGEGVAAAAERGDEHEGPGSLGGSISECGQGRGNGGTGFDAAPISRTVLAPILAKRT